MIIAVLVVKVCREFSLTVSKVKTEIICMHPEKHGEVGLDDNAAGQVY